MAVTYPPGSAGTAGSNMSLYMMLSMLRDDPTVDVPFVKKQHWAYHGEQGPDHWPTSYPHCGGSHQSPVNISTSLVSYDPSLTELRLTGFDQLSSNLGIGSLLNFTNTGHAATIVVSGDMFVEGGGLPGRYKTAEFHFHWGNTPDTGSEHAIDGHKYPMEMHVVSFNERYDTLAVAMDKPEGLAVLAVLFEPSLYDNPDFAPLASALQYIHKAGDCQMLQGVRLRNLMPTDTTRFWRYPGSLTTPRCFESVIWTVFAQPQKISERQVSHLRQLLHESGHDPKLLASVPEPAANSPGQITANFRPLQPLNDRRVLCSFSTPGSAASQPAVPATSNVAQPLKSRCPPEKGYTMHGPHKPPLCLRYVSQMTDYAEAQTFCAADGGHLVHVKTADVWATLQRVLYQVNQHYNVWVGADDRRAEAQHRWSDGTRLSGTDSMWDPDTRGDFAPNKDCVGTRAYVGLLELYCASMYPFFCQIDM